MFISIIERYRNTHLLTSIVRFVLQARKLFGSVSNLRFILIHGSRIRFSNCYCLKNVSIKPLHYRSLFVSCVSELRPDCFFTDNLIIVFGMCYLSFKNFHLVLLPSHFVSKRLVLSLTFKVLFSVEIPGVFRLVSS